MCIKENLSLVGITLIFTLDSRDGRVGYQRNCDPSAMEVVQCGMTIEKVRTL